MKLEKKKISVVTLIDYTNYGNRLQNYALKTYLTEMGYDVETLVIENDSVENKQSYRIISNLFKRNIFTNVNNLFTLHLPRMVQKAKNKLNHDERRKEILDKRIKLFMSFSIENLNERRLKLSEFDSSQYDYVVSGSDQVWNPGVYYDLSIYFLDFVEKGKRISYAASFGVSEVPENLQESYKDWLTDMNSISVREQAGAEIVHKLTGREVPVLVDPTMLLRKEQWLELTRQENKKLESKKYLLTYFLGEQSKETVDKIQNISKEYDLEIIHLNDQAGDIYAADPADFIDYINSSSLFLTDSFHGVVFSIILRKKFVAFKRGKMNSRMNTILSKFGLEGRKASNISSIDELMTINYENVDSILESEKETSDQFLKDALGIEE